MGELAITDKIHNVGPGSYTVRVSLLDNAGAVIVSQDKAVVVPPPAANPVEDPPDVVVT